MESWVSVSPDCHFSLQNLPYGVFSIDGSSPRIGTAIGDYALDLDCLAKEGVFDDLGFDVGVFRDEQLNSYAALGKQVHLTVRKFLRDLLSLETKIPQVLRDNELLKTKAMVHLDKAKMHLPFRISEYTDFFCGLSHAETCVDILMPGKQLKDAFPSFFDLPIGYGGRASSIVVSETPLLRPRGQINKDGKSFASECLKLDFEVELGAFVSHGNKRGQSIAVDEAEDHIFGVVLLNDWSARDIQTWECHLLGPLNGKNFCTSISPWVVPLEALEPFRTSPVWPDRDVVAFMDQSRKDSIFNIPIQASIEADSHKYIVSESNTCNLVFSLSQMLAHHTRGGCPMRTGDLFGTGTLSGPNRDQSGCLLEMSRGGKEAIELTSKTGKVMKRTFLENGDIVEMTALLRTGQNGCGNVGFGTLRGQVLPALEE